VTTIEILSPEASKNTYAEAANINANLSPENHLSVPKTKPTTHSSKDSSQLLKLAKGNNSPNKQHSQEVHRDHSATSSVNDNHDLFVGVEKRRIKRLYLRGVCEGVTDKLISNYINKKGITPTFVRLMKSKRKGTVAVRVNVLSEDFDRALEKDFWPKHVYVREWLSKQKWINKNSSNVGPTKIDETWLLELWRSLWQLYLCKNVVAFIGYFSIKRALVV
jgi:hypothetical protein